MQGHGVAVSPAMWSCKKLRHSDRTKDIDFAKVSCYTADSVPTIMLKATAEFRSLCGIQSEPRMEAQKHNSDIYCTLNRHCDAPRLRKQRTISASHAVRNRARLQLALDAMMRAYEDVYGNSVAIILQQEISTFLVVKGLVGEAMPVSPPRRKAVERGVFGFEEDGNLVTPSEEEVYAITLTIAERLVQIHEEFATGIANKISNVERRALLSSYAEDFGVTASKRLDRWARSMVKVEQGTRHHEFISHVPSCGKRNPRDLAAVQSMPEPSEHPSRRPF
jgi:hypothetical protein